MILRTLLDKMKLLRKANEDEIIINLSPDGSGAISLVDSDSGGHYHAIEFSSIEKLERLIDGEIAKAKLVKSNKSPRERVIELLREVELIMPDDMWLFASEGAIYLMAEIDGERKRLISGGYDVEGLVDVFSIKSEGGDWDS